MSLTAFKNKSVINYGSKRSGIPPGGVWLPQGPFGASTEIQEQAYKTYGPVGFSLNGGHRNIGGVGKDMRMSKSGTPYRGTHPIGWGGNKGAYPSATLVGEETYTGAVPNSGSKAAVVQPVLNSQNVYTLGNQHLFIKPSVLSTRGMLRKKYKWAYYGQYPNYWVQPNYTGNLTDAASQGLYVQTKSAANTCALKVNDAELYANYYKKSGPTLCTPGTSTARFTYNDMARNGPYTKTIRQPVTYDQYMLRLTKQCNNPIGIQKPFPFAVQSGSGHHAAGTSITSFGNACNLAPTYLAPPEWYIKS